MFNKPEFYEKLSTLLNSGISMISALQILESRESGSQRRVIRTIKSLVESGETLAASMEHCPRVFTPFEVSLIRAGELTGNLEINLASLLEHIRKTIGWRRRIITGMIYPFLLLHAGVLLPPLYRLIMESPGSYFCAVWMPLAVIYASLILALMLRALIKKSRIAGLMFERIIWHIPIAGTVARNLATARFLRSLGLSLRSGVNSDTAIKISAEAATSSIIKNSMPVDPADDLRTLGITGVLQNSRILSGMFINMIHTGEESGTVDNSLILMADTIDEKTRTLMDRIIIILPILIYMGVALYIASTIISFYGELFSGILEF